MVIKVQRLKTPSSRIKNTAAIPSVATMAMADDEKLALINQLIEMGRAQIEHGEYKTLDEIFAKY